MGFGGVGCENGPLPLTLALASNTAYCATAHMRDKCKKLNSLNMVLEAKGVCPPELWCDFLTPTADTPRNQRMDPCIYYAAARLFRYET